MSQKKKSEIEIRVDWADLDLFGHVNNVAFFRYIQAARLEYCEKRGLTSLNEKGKYSFMVASSQCQFKRPLHYPGVVRVICKVDWIKNSSFQILYELNNGAGELVATGADVLVLFDHHLHVKVEVGESLREALLNEGHSTR